MRRDTRAVAVDSVRRGVAGVELRLDADALRDASPTLADLRVRDAQGADVP